MDVRTVSIPSSPKNTKLTIRMTCLVPQPRSKTTKPQPLIMAVTKANRNEDVTCN